MSKTPKHLYPAARSRSEPTGRRGVKYESARKHRAHSHRLRDASPWYWFALGFVIYMLAYIAMYPAAARAQTPPPKAPASTSLKLPRVSEPTERRGDVKSAEGSVKWVITPHSDARVPTRHGYCTAEVTLPSKVRVGITLIPATKLLPTRALVTVHGVDFGPPLPAGDSEGLVSIDDGAPVPVYVRRDTPSRTTFELLYAPPAADRLASASDPQEIPEAPASVTRTEGLEGSAKRSEFLFQIANGQVLSVLAGTRVFKVDLAGSLAAVKELHKCNNEGQQTLNKRRLATASPARILSTLNP